MQRHFISWFIIFTILTISLKIDTSDVLETSNLFYNFWYANINLDLFNGIFMFRLYNCDLLDY